MADNETKMEVDQEKAEVQSVENAAPDQNAAPELKREFKPHQVFMFGIACAIGTGLVIGSGTALARGGPGSILISFILVGCAVFWVMASLGEMAAFVPMNKGFGGYAGRMVDPALGYATGWNYFLKYGVTTATNLTACGLVVQYWRPDLNVAIWITIFGSGIIATNLLHVKYFGETQFWFSCAKVLVMCTLIIGCLVVALGGSPSQQRVGFAYWNNPGAFATYLVEGKKGQFLGWWATMCAACFAYAGTEVVGMTFGETPNPRKNIPRAVKQTFWRIAVFYICSVVVLGMAVPYNSDKLIGATKQATSGGASPFVVAFSIAGVEAMGDFVNASLLIFTFSASSSDIYCASRSLYGLARDGQAPKVFAKATQSGVPIYATLAASAFCALGYLNSSKGTAQVFQYLVSVVTVFAVLNWMAILISYLGFRRARKAQGIPDESLPYIGPLQPFGAYYALLISLLVILFNGYDAFIPHFKPTLFVLKYLGTVIFIFNAASWKCYHRTPLYKPDAVDLLTGRREFHEMETMDDAQWNDSWWKRLRSRIFRK